MLLIDHLLESIISSSWGKEIFENIPDQSCKEPLIVSFSRIAKGGVAAVYDCYFSDEGRVAMKFTYDKNTKQTMRGIMEAVIMTALCDIKGVLGAYFAYRSNSTEPPNAAGHLCVVMPIMKESLRDMLDKKKITKKEQLLSILAVLETLSSVHERGIIHRDLKPSNILFNNINEAHISDWGTAKIMSMEKFRDGSNSPLVIISSEEREKFRAIVESEHPTAYYEEIERGVFMGISMDDNLYGTVPYMAPESLMKYGKVNTESQFSDTWSIAMMIIEICSGIHPYTYLSTETHLAQREGSIEKIKLMYVYMDLLSCHQRGEKGFLNLIIRTLFNNKSFLSSALLNTSFLECAFAPDPQIRQ